eukprot:TRINITY_DN9723_c0_g1_i3.p1 TRINITY_DN9723_c0_g1~~TRINITY_DN9723_c0_g1_i3.p1  ORF type:complete len:385 (-),score=114.16 TRINITY_DN9723_c0_g1_i3:254-1408(-)
MIVIIIPFCTFYYEAYDSSNPSIASQLKSAIGFTLGSVIIFAICLVVLWIVLGTAEIPYKSQVSPMFSVSNMDWNPACTTCKMDGSAVLSIPVSIVVYGVAILNILGWVVFVIFGGVGMGALPIDLMSEWYHRPKPLTLDQYATEKKRLAEVAEELMEKGGELEKEQKKQGEKLDKKLRSRVHAFKILVDALQSDQQKMESGYTQGGGSPILAVGKLLLGILTMAVSLLWLLHVLLWNILAITPFLNTLFVELDDFWSMAGTVAYAVFTFFLLWAVMKGVIKVGSRSLIFEIHPLKVRGTLMNAFLFNTLLLLLASVTVTQFAAQSFEIYSSATSVNSLFSTYMLNLKGIGFIFKYFQYGYLGVAVISIILLLVCPYNPSKGLQ